MLNELYTTQGEAITQTPWQEYPRPQLKRDSFFCLNGWWDFAVTAENTPPTTYDKTIRVPYPAESLLSEVGESIPAGRADRDSGDCPGLGRGPQAGGGAD